MARSTSVALALAVALIANVGATRPQAAESHIERAFAEYAAGDLQAISRIIPPRYFDRMESRTRRREIDAALLRWARDWRPVHAVFLLELVHFALAGVRESESVEIELARFGLADVRETDAVELLERARAFVTSRPDTPGRNLQADAFEIAWHKAAIALLGGLRRPDVLERVGVGPLRRRMAASPPASGEARLVDPWIELASAILLEQRTIVDPRMLASAGPAAIRRFDEAARYDEKRSEALVRKAWLLVRLGRHREAVAVLGTQDGLSDLGDTSVQYWSQLFRARALDSLRHDEEAARAYEEALAIVPGAQAPLAALTALEMRRGNVDAACRWAVEGRSASPASVDPWLHYGTADYRHFRARLERLRKAGR